MGSVMYSAQFRVALPYVVLYCMILCYVLNQLRMRCLTHVENEVCLGSYVEAHERVCWDYNGCLHVDWGGRNS